VERGLNSELCHSTIPGYGDDLILGQCMLKLGAILADSRDQKGKQRFLHFSPLELIKNASGCHDTIKEYDFFANRVVRLILTDRIVSSKCVLIRKRRAVLSV
jgi:hypothetical protein